MTAVKLMRTFTLLCLLAAFVVTPVTSYGQQTNEQKIRAVERQLRELQSELNGLRSNARTGGRDSGIAPLTKGEFGPEWIAPLSWREVGPANMGGRVTDIAVYEKDPTIFWAAAASGGLMKSTNAGVTMQFQFDHEEAVSIGDVTVAPSDPNVVWVGTGENNPRNSVSYGNGVYKSTDGGDTWTHMGLRESYSIGRIAIHPTNPDIVYVGALGRLWGPNKERGLFKTTDGGETWNNILYIDEETGVMEVQMHPNDPNTLLIATYSRERDLYDNIPNYDPSRKWSKTSGIYKTTNGGRSFEKMADGLPSVRVGRICIDYHRNNPDIVYAIIETELVAMGKEQLDTLMAEGIPEGGVQYGRSRGEARPFPSSYGGQQGNIQDQQGEHGYQTGGIFRSEDGGESWSRVNSLNPRPMYFSQLRVDPSDDNFVYVCGVGFSMSSDGGKSFGGAGRGMHRDQHALWINPNDGRHLLCGCDGGLYVSHDRMQNMEHLNSLSISQFYHIFADNQEPYYVYGGLQDNGSWKGPSRSLGGSITNANWVNIGGGDGYVVKVDPEDSNQIYYESQDGSMNRRHLLTGESGRIRPTMPNGERARFNWDTPFFLSNFNSKVFYCAGQYVFRSVDKGNNLKIISPDITNTERGSSTRLGESPLNRDVLYVGTDDGALWGTTDGGLNWSKFDDKMGLPKPMFVTGIECSRFEAGRCYVAFDGHRSDNDDPWVFVTEDFGATWTNITNNLPWGSAHRIREDVENPNILYFGSEVAIFVSVDRGGSWTKLNNNLPTTPIHDIYVHPTAGEIVVGTHGRGVWILDVAPLRQITAEALDAKATLYKPNTVTKWRSELNFRPTGAGHFQASNPPSGAQICYSLTEDAEEISLKILDIKGDTVSELNAEAGSGMHMVNWNFSRSAPRVQGATGGQRGQRGQGGQRQAPRGRRGAGGGGGGQVGVGEYRVVLTVDGEEFSQILTYRADPVLAKKLSK